MRKAIAFSLLFLFLVSLKLPVSAMGFTKKQMKAIRCVGKIENFLGEDRRISGSGTLLESDYVLSCYHVIRNGIGQLTISFQDGDNIIRRGLTVISFNAEDDLGLYKLDKPMPKRWGCAKIAKRLTAGDRLMYAGFNASALARLRFDLAEEYEEYGTMLHPVYYGDSGGGVFKLNGRLVGVIHILIIDARFGYRTNSYVGYAVSLEKIRKFLDERGRLG